MKTRLSAIATSAASVVATAITTAVLTVITLGIGTQSASALEDGQWYVSPMLQFLDDDADRVSDAGYGAHLGLGRMLSDKWALEGILYGNKFEGGGYDWEQWGVGADVIRHFDFGWDNLTPYLLVGAGYITTQTAAAELSPAPGDYDNAEAHVGAGLTYALGQRWHLRSDVRYRRDFNDVTDLDDVQVNLGFLVPLGSVTPKVVDTDVDGVADNLDRCPGTPMGTLVDPRGCELDTDGDGVKDSVDQCPDTAAGVRVDVKGCEVKAKDSDRDGVADKSDRCPGTPAGVAVDKTGCELDSDGDGVVDRRDRCPQSKRGVRVDIYGCAIKDKIALPSVKFETNSARLTTGSLDELNAAAETLKKNDDLRVEAAGHTDSVGKADYNQTLSQKRAEAVRRYLVSRGVDATKITARGYGESEPRADNSTAEGRQQNRRVTLRILN